MDYLLFFIVKKKKNECFKSLFYLSLTREILKKPICFEFYFPTLKDNGNKNAFVTKLNKKKERKKENKMAFIFLE